MTSASATEWPDQVTKKALYWLDVLHLADITDDALIGKTKVSHQAETLGRSKAANTFFSKYFDKGLFLGATISYPVGSGIDDDRCQRYRASDASRIWWCR